jgi:DNA-directed RNA polymerase specialized sigma subunit
MDDDELSQIIEKHWTAAELVEFLGLDVSDIVEKFTRLINKNINAILDEVGYTSDEDETEL